MLSSQFLELKVKYNNQKLIYLDTAASALKPQAVIETEKDFLSSRYSNISRGISNLSVSVTKEYAQARQKVLQFVTSKSNGKLVITNSATTALNMAASFYEDKLQLGDEILVSYAEHHSNFLPWIKLAKKTGAVLKVLEVDNFGQLTIDNLVKVLNPKIKVVALTYVSNVTGAITPVRQMAELIHKAGADFIVDAAQAVGHMPVDFSEIDCEMAAWSAHKVYGPTALGFLYCKDRIIDEFSNFLVGGGTVDDINFADSDIKPIYKKGLEKLEAGTPPISQMIAFAKSIEMLQTVNIKNIVNHEKQLTEELINLQSLPGIEILGSISSDNRLGIISFTHQNIHPHDLGQFLDDAGVVCRVGHNCAVPIHRRFGKVASVRFSLGLYNNLNDVKQAIAVTKEAINFLDKV
ncbi:MAG: cysteine desulfurase [Bifidobacteriaceae bacterium]|nr:cysteine desulfurase [Bifidobacteriaceae bacterium]